MSAKRLPVGRRAVGGSDPEQWVRLGDARGADRRGEVYGARLTIDVTVELRGRIKVTAFRQGMTVAELLRTLLEREFPDEPEGRA